MSKVSERRKMLQEIERVFKLIKEGLDDFDVKFKEAKSAATKQAKEKFTDELTKKLTKLKRFRENVIAWSNHKDVKDRTNEMEEMRLDIEIRMEAFRAMEKEDKIKPFSERALEMEPKINPKEKERDQWIAWLRTTIYNLNQQCEPWEAELEKLTSVASVAQSQQQAAPKRNKSRGCAAAVAGGVYQQTAERIDQYTKRIEQNRNHVAKLELILRALHNDCLTIDDLSNSELKKRVQCFLDAQNASRTLLADDALELYDELLFLFDNFDSNLLISSPNSGDNKEAADVVGGSTPPTGHSKSTVDNCAAGETTTFTPPVNNGLRESCVGNGNGGSGAKPRKSVSVKHADIAGGRGSKIFAPLRRRQQSTVYASHQQQNNNSQQHHYHVKARSIDQQHQQAVPKPQVLQYSAVVASAAPRQTATSVTATTAAASSPSAGVVITNLPKQQQDLESLKTNLNIIAVNNEQLPEKNHLLDSVKKQVVTLDNNNNNINNARQGDNECINEINNNNIDDDSPVGSLMESDDSVVMPWFVDKPPAAASNRISDAVSVSSQALNAIDFILSMDDQRDQYGERSPSLLTTSTQYDEMTAGENVYDWFCSKRLVFNPLAPTDPVSLTEEEQVLKCLEKSYQQVGHLDDPATCAAVRTMHNGFQARLALQTRSYYPTTVPTWMCYQDYYDELKDVTLLWIFYYMERTHAQHGAIAALQKRGWMFHTRDRRWYMRIGERTIVTEDYEEGIECYSCMSESYKPQWELRYKFIYHQPGSVSIFCRRPIGSPKPIRLVNCSEFCVSMAERNITNGVTTTNYMRGCSDRFAVFGINTKRFVNKERRQQDCRTVPTNEFLAKAGDTLLAPMASQAYVCLCRSNRCNDSPLASGGGVLSNNDRHYIVPFILAVYSICVNLHRLSLVDLATIK